MRESAPYDPNALRAFIALPIPDALKAQLERMQDELRRTGADAKWVKPENFHVTLFFLGSTPPDRLEQIRGLLPGLCARHAPFTVELHGLGAFPNTRRPSILWAGLTGDLGPLKALAADVGEAMVDLGFEKEHPFKPHLTLARTRSSSGAGALSDMLHRLKDETIGSFAAEEVVLYRSDLRPKGPIYTPLERYPLG